MPCALRFVTAFAAFAIAGPLMAQSAPQDTISPQGVTAPATLQATVPIAIAHAPSFAPAADSASVGVRVAAVRPAPAPALPPRRADSSRNRALMIVGGATLLVGAIVGGNAGTIIMIGGGAIGIYGLYNYLQ